MINDTKVSVFFEVCKLYYDFYIITDKVVVETDK